MNDSEGGGHGPETVAGYSGVINSNPLAGFTSAEGYTGVVVSPSTSSAPQLPSAPNVEPVAEAWESRLEQMGRPEASAADRYVYHILTGGDLWDALAAPPPPPPEEPPTPPPPTPQEPTLPMPEALEAALESDRVGTLRRMLQPSPSYSKQTNETIGQIQNQMDTLRLLKPSLIAAGYVVDAGNKVRGLRGVPGALAPSASPTGRSAKKLMPEMAQTMERVTQREMSKLVDLQLIRRDLSQEERVLWQQAAEVLSPR